LRLGFKSELPIKIFYKDVGKPRFNNGVSIIGTVPEFINPVFAKTSSKRSFSVIENERFGLVFAKTEYIISGTGHPSSVNTLAVRNKVVLYTVSHLFQQHLLRIITHPQKTK
jgi:hypothetical protein